MAAQFGQSPYQVVPSAKVTIQPLRDFMGCLQRVPGVRERRQAAGMGEFVVPTLHVKNCTGNTFMKVGSTAPTSTPRRARLVQAADPPDRWQDQPMDQGLAAVWAGIAGLAGAGIGGGAAVWGAAIGGKKTVEAAVQAEQRAAAAEHQHWQRQARYDAYRAVMAIAEETSRWTQPISVSTVVEASSRLREAIAAVDVVGPAEAS